MACVFKNCFSSYANSFAFQRTFYSSRPPAASECGQQTWEVHRPSGNDSSWNFIIWRISDSILTPSSSAFYRPCVAVKCNCFVYLHAVPSCFDRYSFSYHIHNVFHVFSLMFLSILQYQIHLGTPSALPHSLLCSDQILSHRYASLMHKHEMFHKTLLTKSPVKTSGLNLDGHTCALRITLHILTVLPGVLPE